MKKANLYRHLLRYFGLRRLAGRARHSAMMRAGIIRRRMPTATWEAQPLRAALREAGPADPQAYLDYRRHKAPAFFFSPGDKPQYAALFAGWDRESQVTPVSVADGLLRGESRYFEHTTVAAGTPPDWHANPLTGGRTAADRHWSLIGDFGSGDIKVIWEASRFGAVYALVRAYWRTSDERYAELFWQLVESWRRHNPPQWGPNWKCGQETSFRVMAWCFGLYGFLGAEATTAERVWMLAQMMAVSGGRIRGNLAFALNQANNHGISEGMGLWTIGTLFPELRRSSEWRKVGRRVLEQEGRTLIYDDGAFSQHSVNYHRLMLHDYLWALRLGDLLGAPFSQELKRRVATAGEFLYQIQDEVSGQVPYYGQNDGALILPLTNCDYKDFRPVTAAVHYLATGRRLHEPGPWDEAILWLFGPQALACPGTAETPDPPRREDLQARSSGYYTLRAGTGFAFTRAPVFRHRPGQADALHVDIWWRGQNMALDAGTYSYNAPPPWDNPLAHTAYHNTVSVDGMDQMERVGRFMWLPWLRGRMRLYRRSGGGRLTYWEGEHDGYHRLPAPVTHRRGILRLGDEHWLVLDRLTSPGSHLYRLHWLLPDLPHTLLADRLLLQTRHGPYSVSMAHLNGADGGSPDADRCLYSLVRADEDCPRGWHAPYYNYREPALSFALESRADCAFFWTLLGPNSALVEARGSRLEVKGDGWKAAVSLRLDGPENRSMVNSVQIETAETTTGRLA